MIALINKRSRRELIQLLECLLYTPCTPGGNCIVESFLRGIEVVHDQQRPAACFLERYRGDLPTVATFFIGPDEARVRCHLEVSTEELHGVRGSGVPEHEAAPASDTNVPDTVENLV